MESDAEWTACEAAFFEDLPALLDEHGLLTVPASPKLINKKLYAGAFESYTDSLFVLLRRCEPLVADADERQAQTFLSALAERLIERLLRGVRPTQQPLVETRFTIALFLVPGIQEYPSSALHPLANAVLAAWHWRYPKIQLGKGTRAQIEAGHRRSLLDWISTAFGRQG